MTADEFKEFTVPRAEKQTLSVEDLANKTPRTLLLGYTANRNIFHVYLKDGIIHRLIYVTANEQAHEALILSRGEATRWGDVSLLVPDTRIYPEASDLEFCRLLRGLGFYLPFSKFNSEREHRDFYGHVVDA